MGTAQRQDGLASAFDYAAAFSRNIGWLTREEQARLRTARVAIAGTGGVGGSHALTLARLGVGRFTLADPDRFELANMNRQAGARMDTLGRPKAGVIAEMVRAINPEAEVRVLEEAVTERNLDAFLEGADVYLDGLDFFVLDLRPPLFEACRRRGIPAVIAGPLGLSAAMVTFVPGGMPFEAYFGFEGRPPVERALRFLIGLAPAMLHRTYLVDPSAVDLEAQRGPSTGIAVELCAGLAAAQAMKLLLGRGPVLPAPWSVQVDAYRLRLRRTWRPGGHRNPLQRAALAYARRRLARMRQSTAG